MDGEKLSGNVRFEADQRHRLNKEQRKRRKTKDGTLGCDGGREAPRRRNHRSHQASLSLLTCLAALVMRSDGTPPTDSGSASRLVKVSSQSVPETLAGFMDAEMDLIRKINSQICPSRVCSSHPGPDPGSELRGGPDGPPPGFELRGGPVGPPPGLKPDIDPRLLPAPPSASGVGQNFHFVAQLASDFLGSGPHGPGSVRPCFGF